MGAPVAAVAQALDQATCKAGRGVQAQLRARAPSEMLLERLGPDVHGDPRCGWARAAAMQMLRWAAGCTCHAGGQCGLRVACGG